MRFCGFTDTNPGKDKALNICTHSVVWMGVSNSNTSLFPASKVEQLNSIKGELKKRGHI